MKHAKSRTEGGTRRDFLKATGAAAGTVLAPRWLPASAPEAPGPPKKKPSIVCILADDLGYGSPVE